MTRFWHRRSSEAIMLVGLALVGVFAWGYLGGTDQLNRAMQVPVIPAVSAGLILIVGLVGYFFAPLKSLQTSAAINYALLIITLALLVMQTDGLQSGYFPLLVATLGFAGAFGLGGIFAGTGGFAVFMIMQYMGRELGESDIMLLSLLCALPLIASFIIWGRSEKVTEETKKDRSYHELASELSQVSGKSEVVINAIGDGVLALNGQGTIELINPAAEQILGWDKHDSLTLTYKSILKMLDTKNKEVTDTNDPVALVLANNKPVKNDSFSLQTQSGKTFLASITVSPVGQPGQGVIVVFRDITTEKSDERQRAEFISTASHEMRTPVASIEGYLGLALNPATASIDPKAREFITKAHASAQHLGRLFSDLLDVSKADDSRLKNDPKVVDIVPFIHEIIQGLTPKATEKGLRVHYKPMPDGMSLENDPNRRLNPVLYSYVDNDHLREVVQNLIENAIKYTLKGEVVVDVTSSDSHIVISVTDTGIGIPREDQRHLFQKFYRVDNSDTREIGGTGLGLYLCRRLTETMGGRIWVESEYKHGSTFFVEIARIEHDEAQRRIEQASVEAEQQVAQEKLHAASLATPAEPQVTPLVDSSLPQPGVTPSTLPAPVTPSLPPTPAAPQSLQPTPAVNVNRTNTPITTIEANTARTTPRISVPPRQ